MDVLVLGGGIAGLSAARALVERGHQPLLLEASDRPGGVIRTTDLGGAIFENGPQGFLDDRPGAMDLVESLGVTDQLLPAADAARTRYLLHDDRLVPLPMSPPGLLATPLLSLGGRLRVLAEPWAKGPPPEPESVHAFAARRIGREAADVLVDAMVTGIFAGDPKQLSLEACFPKMRRLEAEHGGLIRGMIAKKRAARHDARTNAPAAGGPSGGKLHSLRDGMESLPRAVADALGDRVRLGVRVASLARAGSGWRVVADGGETLEAAQVIVTTPARVTAPLLDDVSPAVAAELRQIVYASVAGVGLLYRREDVDHALDGYGFLAPGGRRDVLGCLFESTVFPNRAPAGHVFLRAMMGGARRPDVGSRTPEELILTATDSLRGLLGLHGDPVAAGTWHHAHAIPQYDLDHPARLQRIARCLKDTPGLHLGGAALRGASVNLLAAEGHALAAAVDAGAVDTDAVDAGAAS